MLNKTLHIPNISCEHCVRTIQNELSELTGVKNVSVSLSERSVRISYEDENVWEEIIALLNELNYPPQ